MHPQCSLNGRRKDEGQSLLETAICMPLLLGVAFNIINFAYFWFMILALSASPRMGAEYSTQGGQSIAVSSAPSASAVSTIVYDNMTHGVVGPTTSNTAVRVCNSSVGIGSGGVALCQSFGPGFTFPAVTADPEQPVFVLNRVDVEFTVKPLISGAAFNVILPANLNFQRHVTMRSLY